MKDTRSQALTYTAIIFLAIVLVIVAYNRGQQSAYSGGYEDSYEETNSYTPARRAAPRQKTERELRQELGDKERRNPLNYLRDRSKWVKEPFTKKVIVSGTIYNNATIARFKDIELLISFSSTTGTVMGSVSKTIYQRISPTSSTEFKAKVRIPRSVDKRDIKRVSVDIVGARAY